MNHIEDERIKFYLEHEERIKEWAAIENDVPEVAHGFFLSLRTDVDNAIRDGTIDGPPNWGVQSCVRREDTKWPQVGLRRMTWPYFHDLPDTGGKFSPKIVIEWKRGSTGFSGGHLVCGAHVDTDKDLEQFHSRKDHRDYPKGPNHAWFRYRHLKPPDPGFWNGDGLAKYRKDLLSQLFKAWKDLAPAIDKAACQAADNS